HGSPAICDAGASDGGFEHSGFESARLTTGAPGAVPPDGVYSLRSDPSVVEKDEAPSIERRVRSAYTSGGWVHTIFHRICDCPPFPIQSCHYSAAPYTCVDAPAPDGGTETLTSHETFTSFLDWLQTQRDRSNPADLPPPDVKVLVKSQQQVIGLENPS